MSETAFYIETRDGEVKKTNYELATLVRESGRQAIGVLIGGDAGQASQQLGPYGVSRILHLPDDAAGPYNPEFYARCLAGIIRDREIEDFLAAWSETGRDLLGRLAAKLGAPMAGDCLQVDLDKSEAVQPVYSGKVHARYKLTGDVRLYGLRPNALAAAAGGGGAAEVETLTAEASDTLLDVREVVESVSKGVDLAEAQIVVSGGYGMGSAENFGILEDLAEVLDAAVGASRRAVDEGLAPYPMQVGQTGKVVNPELYVACGISGAVQHLAGMKSARTIVAVNKDPDAPILKKAHYGIVGDLFEVVPMLTEEFRKTLSK